MIGPPLSVRKETVTSISVYYTDSPHGAALFNTKYQKLYYHTALANTPTLPFDIMLLKICHT